MEIVLYLNNTENHRVSKAPYLQEVISLEGTLRDDCEISSPEILLELPFSEAQVLTGGLDELVPNVYTNMGAVPIFNYAYIPSFHRFYFVTGITAVSAGKQDSRLYRVTMRVDVLMSFKDYFLTLEAFISRNEFDYDLSIKDEGFPFMDSVSYERLYLSDMNITFKSKFDNKDEFIALNGYITKTGFDELWRWNDETVIDGQTLYYWPTKNRMFAELMGETQEGLIEKPSGSFFDIEPIAGSPQAGAVTYLLTKGEYLHIFTGTIKENQKSYIKTIYAFPLRLTDYVNTRTKDNVEEYRSKCPMVLGDELVKEADIPGLPIVDFSLSNDMSRYIKVGEYTFPEYDFRNDDPYCSWYLYLPYLGRVNLDYAIFAGKTIIFYLTFNLSDGSAVLYCHDPDSVRTSEINFTIGRRIAVDSTNSQEVENNKIANATSTALGVISSIVTLTMGAVTENPIAVTGGVMGLAKTISGAVINNLNNIPRAQTSNVPSVMGITMPKTIVIEKVKKDYSIEDEAEYRHLYGLPLRDFRVLNTITGYTEVGKIHLEDVPALDGEKEEIDRLLKGGVIL